MSETSAPWRALEDGPVLGAAPGGAGGPGGPESAAAAARMPWWKFAAFGLAALLIGGAVFLAAGTSQGSVAVDGDGAAVVPSSTRPGASGVPAPRGELVVDVQGAVLRPGVVHLAAGSRVADAITAAGGYGPRVAVDRVGQVLNLAALLKDGDQVVVPSRDEPVASSGVPGGGADGSGGAGGGGPVDLNHATASELDALPGIGPVTAAKIIAAREEQPFGSLEDLRTRKVLGPAALEKIKDLVVVR